MITQLAKMVVVSRIRLQIQGAEIFFAFVSSRRVSFTNKALKPNKQPQKQIWSENRGSQQDFRQFRFCGRTFPVWVPVYRICRRSVPVGVPVCMFSRRFVRVCRFHHHISVRDELDESQTSDFEGK
jgi:hypothetical protein